MSIERDKFIVKILNAIIYITLAISIGASLYRYIDQAPERARIKQLETERDNIISQSYQTIEELTESLDQYKEMDNL